MFKFLKSLIQHGAVGGHQNELALIQFSPFSFDCTLCFSESVPTGGENKGTTPTVPTSGAPMFKWFGTSC